MYAARRLIPFAAALRRRRGPIALHAGLGAAPVTTSAPATAPAPSWTDALKTSLTAAIPALSQAYQQKKLFNLQMQRAQQGLPPLEVEQYTPPMRVQAGVDTGTQRLIGWGIAGALGLGALFLLSRGRRRG